MNNYFDNKMVENLIMTYKQEKEEVKREALKNKIMENVNEIIKRIISCYSYNRFEEIDDLIQHASEACYKSIKNFNPEHPKYSSAFNWFSLTAKRSLLNYTLRKQKHRGHKDIDDYFDIEYQKKEVSLYFVENELSKEIIHIIDLNYVGQQRLNYIKITLVLINYLSKNFKFKKAEFYAWARSHGFTNAICRQYIKDIGTFFNKITNDITMS
jgi:hypothetical protein